MDPSGRSTRDGWWISGLLFLATMINYMDRQTLSNLIPRITDEWRLTNEQYGDMELVFGVAFAAGSLAFGWAADRLSVRWLYPAILVAWSAVGFATGLTTGHGSMLVCRGLLGFFEAGHWPCALVVTQSVLSRQDRVMGNSILQSGASAGAVLTPLVIGALIGGSTAPGGWRAPFLVIGGAGLLWAVAWWALVPPGLLPSRGGPSRGEAGNDLAPAPGPAKGRAADRGFRWLADLLIDRRFWALVLMVVAINTSWQLVRAWLPTFLQRGRGYSEAATLAFNALYFLFADVGCIAVGAATLALTRRGFGVHAGRMLAFLAAALLAALTTLAALLPQGWPLLATLLAVAAGTLGVFPCYYAFTQELSITRMGRVTGMLSCLGWLASSPVQKLFGAVADRTGSYDLNLAILGWAPLAGLAAFWLLWPRERNDPQPARRRGDLLRRLLAAASVSYLLALVFGTHYPRPEQLVGRGVSDKLLHFVAYAGLGSLVAAMLASFGRTTIRATLGAAAALMLIAAADEITQPLFRRTADPIDWVFDLLGILTGLIVVGGLVRLAGRSRAARA